LYAYFYCPAIAGLFLLEKGEWLVMEQERIKKCVQEQKTGEQEEQGYMRRAIQLARLGEGYVHPNPLVGAVIVKDGRIIGEGYHQAYGRLHAERNAIAALQENAKGATLYVTLEPCCHYGKTPPCTEAILEQGIGRVVIGSRDPNPLVSGKGVAFLRSHGVEVVEDFLREECDALNSVFFHYITEKQPYVILKFAQTMDGKIATKTGDSKWISNEESRMDTQYLRHRCMGILVGIQTVLQDDPMLNVRCKPSETYQMDSAFIDTKEVALPPRNPCRIVLDSNLRIPLDSKLVKTAREIPTIVVTRQGDATQEFIDRENQLKALQVQVWKVKVHPKTGGLCIKEVLRRLGEINVDSVLIEGGGSVHASALQENVVQEIQVYIAPKIFGGAGPSPVKGIGVDQVADAYAFHLQELKRFGDDVKMVYRKEAEDVYGNY